MNLSNPRQLRAWPGLFLFCLALAACAPKAQPVASEPADSYWLASAQTEPSAQIAAIAAGLGGHDDFARISEAMLYVAQNLAFDPYLNREQFNRSAADLFQDGTLGGCSDFALAQMALFRAQGFPARLALSANLKWIERYKKNSLATPNGHSFVEVKIQGRWYLVDPTYFALFGDYEPGAQYLPGNEIFMARGRDFKDVGIENVEDANRMLVKAAEAYAGGYQSPPNPEIFRLKLDFPRTFVSLSKTLIKAGRYELARHLLRKSLELEPGNKEAAEMLKGLGGK